MTIVNNSMLMHLIIIICLVEIPFIIERAGVSQIQKPNFTLIRCEFMISPSNIRCFNSNINGSRYSLHGGFDLPHQIPTKNGSTIGYSVYS